MEDQARARERGLSLLVVVVMASLVMAIAHPLLYLLLGRVFGVSVGINTIADWVMGGISLVIDLVAIAAWLALARATPRDRAGLANATLALIFIQLIPTIAFQILRLRLPGGYALSVVPSLLYIAELVLGWLALLRLGGEALQRTARGLTVGMWTSIGVRLLVVAANAMLFSRLWGSASDLSVTDISQYYAITNYVRIGVVVTYAILVLVLVKRLRAVPTDAANQAVGEPAFDPGATPDADILWGSIMLAGGVLVSVASYAMAHQGGGGRYIFTTGLIGVGIGRLIRGLRRR